MAAVTTMARRRLLTVVLTLACLVVTACRAGGTTSPAPSPAASPSDGARPPIVHLADFRIEPNFVVSTRHFRVEVVNDGPTPHTLTVRDDATGRVLLTTSQLRPGTEAALAGTIEPGRYTLFCALPGHESLGMHGTLVVEDQAAP